MQDLRLVGVHEDGEHLLLTDGEGGRFLLTVDEPLRAAVRRDRARLGQLQIEMSGELRPRDIQARIRAGASAEEVASLSGWPVERVRRYEGPVLAERSHVADLARSTPVRRRGGDPGRTATLGTRVAERLEGRGVDPESADWDSWRTEDGPWTVTVRFAAGGREREARWRFEPSARTLSPGDDEARWLSEDEPAAAPSGPLPGPRLVAVETSSERVYDVDADGGVRPGRGHDEEGRPRLDLMEAMRSRRAARRTGRPPATPTGRGSAPTDDADALDEAVDLVVTGDEAAGPPAPPDLDLDVDDARLDAAGEPPAAHPPASRLHRWPVTPPEAEDADAPHVEDGEPEVEAQDESPEPEPPPAPATRREASARRKSSKSRASVPSWDDIMFGGGGSRRD